MQWLITYAFSLVARTHRYQWGGDDPIGGFDCSGLVLELLKASGEMKLSTPKMSAQMIYDHYSQMGNYRIAAGSLSFYGPDVHHIYHIGFCVDSNLMIEAGGGDASTVDDQRAIAQNAFVRVRPIRARKDFLVAIRPPYSLIGELP